MKVLVVGGSSGIGKETVQLLKAQGHHVEWTYHKNSQEGGIPFHFDSESSESLIKHMNEQNYEGLVLSAFPPPEIKLLKKFSYDEIQAYIDPILESYFYLCVSFARTGEKKKILNISTANLCLEPVPQMGPYTIAKAALEAMLNTLRAENKKRGLAVCHLCPSMTKTEFLREMYPDRYIELAAENHPIGRLADPKEVAQAAVMLLTNPYLDGVRLPITGGLL